MRETLVLRNGKWLRKQDAPPLHAARDAPMVIGDTLPGGALRHPSTGKMMDSKSRFRAETRARGCVEVGNDVRPTRRVSGVRGCQSWQAPPLFHPVIELIQRDIFALFLLIKVEGVGVPRLHRHVLDRFGAE